MLFSVEFCGGRFHTDVCISRVLHDQYLECRINGTPMKCNAGGPPEAGLRNAIISSSQLSDMLKYVGFSPPASASGPFLTGLAPPHCIFPNTKLLPETCGQITNVSRVYLNTGHTSEKMDHKKSWEFINSTHWIYTFTPQPQHSKTIPVSPGVSFCFCNVAKYMSKWIWNDASEFRHCPDTLHGERFPCACLTVCKYGSWKKKWIIISYFAKTAK